jgi:hypothetical protein
MIKLEIADSRILIAEKTAASTNKIRHKRVGRKTDELAAIATTKKAAYPKAPHIGTGSPINMEKGLWETVSQFIALDMAQKLL